MSDRLSITFTGANASVEADKFYTWFVKRGYNAFNRSRGGKVPKLPPLHFDMEAKADFWIDTGD